jgi:signal transduction histidine kinase
MRCNPRQKIYLVLATLTILVHLAVAAACSKPTFSLTLFGDGASCALVILAILAIRENITRTSGILSVFWKVFAAGLLLLLASQVFWFYFDWRRQSSVPSPVPGDCLFLVAHVFFLSALALRPHSSSQRRDLPIRSLDFVLLSGSWLCLYAYFALPWQILAHDLSRYNPAFYLLTLLQHLVLVVALGALGFRRRSAWRLFYFQSMLTFLLIAAGNLAISVAIDAGRYYAGSFYDTPIFLGFYLLTVMACVGSALEPSPDATSNRELIQSVWTARIAMLVMLSLPVIALWGLTSAPVPRSIAIFRLRLVFASMFVLGSLAYWKVNLLSRELVRLVRLTRDSIENLRTVQQQVSHTEKFVALGRLAAGAAHEISNPLTAILGYSELLTDIPSLSAEDRAHAQQIREHVHRAQAAVASLRNTLRGNSSSPPPSLVIDKNPVS